MANPFMPEIKVTVGGTVKSTMLHAISKGGSVILNRGLEVKEGDAFTIDLPGAGTLAASIVAKTDAHTHAPAPLPAQESGAPSPKPLFSCLAEHFCAAR